MNENGSSSPGMERARWLAQLADAIDQAQLVAWKLGIDGTQSAEAFELYCRLETAREEIEQLRSGGWRASRNPIGPKPTQFTSRAMLSFGSAKG